MTVTVNDFESLLDAEILPLCAKVTAFAIESPIPVPPVLEFLDESER